MTGSKTDKRFCKFKLIIAQSNIMKKNTPD